MVSTMQTLPQLQGTLYTTLLTYVDYQEPTLVLQLYVQTNREAAPSYIATSTLHQQTSETDALKYIV